MKLIDLTPAEFACSMSMACPAVLKSEDGLRYVLIGKQVEVPGRVGEGEAAVEIPTELLESAIRKGD